MRQSGIRVRPYTPRHDSRPGLTRGVVIRVIPSEDVDSQILGVDPMQTLCDVLLVRGGLLRAPVLQHGSSVSNVSRWVPVAATRNMVTGAPVKVVADGVAPAPASPEDLDGEIVLVDFIERDINRPIIIGSLEHPRGRRQTIGWGGYPAAAPAAARTVHRHSSTSDRYVAHQGVTARISRPGNLEVDLRQAGLANGGSSFDGGGDGSSGLLDVAMRDAGEMILRGVAGLPFMRARAVGGGKLLIGRSPSGHAVLAGPLVDHLVAWEERIRTVVTAVARVITASVGQTVRGDPPDLAILADAGNPAGYPPTAEADRGKLGTARLMIDPAE